MADEQPKKYIELTPNIISKIVNDKDEYDLFLKALREGTTDDFFKRDKKAYGGLAGETEERSVGSLMDNDIRQPEKPKFILELADAGMTRDQEIGLHLFIIGSGVGPGGGMSGDQIYAIEQSEKWLLENLSDTEKRKYGLDK